MICNDKPLSHIDPFAEVVESFYLETQEGLFFAVKGLKHPPDRIIAVLRYAPDPEKGDRKKGGESYRRLYHFAEQEQLIRSAFPQFFAFDHVFQTTLQSVPRSMVQRIYDPRLRLQELSQSPAGSAIEQDALAFLRLLQNDAGVPSSALGITGSLLIGLHTENSDLDVVVLGAESCIKVFRTLGRLLDTLSCMELRRLDFRGMKELFAQRVVDTRMAFTEFANLERRKVNQGRFRDRTYFIRFVREAHEVSETYGQLRYTPLGRAVIAATIDDDEEAIFTPCRYSLSNVRILEGPQVSNLNEITSFRGRFCEQARVGESVIAAGTLERIEANQGDIRHRLLMGNSRQDSFAAKK